MDKHAHPHAMDVVALAKVDVPTYTQRLIDDLKKHEDEYRRKELETFDKDKEIDGKDPFRMEYKVTKGALEDPDIVPDEAVIMRNSEQDVDRWKEKSELKAQRKKKLEDVRASHEKLKVEVLNSTSFGNGSLKNSARESRLRGGNEELRQSRSNEKLIKSSIPTYDDPLKAHQARQVEDVYLKKLRDSQENL